MSRWFRVYGNMAADPKVQRLSADLFRFLVNLWCLACDNDGKLPSLGDVAYTLHLRQDRAKRMLAELKECGLIDDSPDGGLEPHNWNGRQYKSDGSNERVKRHRERKCNVTSAVTATPPEQITEQRQIQKEERIGSFQSVGGEAVKKRKTPAHGAVGKNHIWVMASSQDWTAYAEDFRAAHGEYPKPDDRGGKWFKVSGEQQGRVA